MLKFLQDSTKIIDTLLHSIMAALVLQTICFVFLSCCLLINMIPRVDIENYPESIDYGILSKEQIETFDDIICAAQNGELSISCPVFSDKEQHEIATQLSLHLGTVGNIGDLVYWNDSSVELNLGMLKKLMDQKVVIDARIDEAVSTLTEGSDEYKLWQISNYIAKKIEYEDGFRNIITALNGKGVCDSYAMLFYKMATRLGIQNYICYGYTSNGGYHAWNVVSLDGNPVYFDITWYDNYIRDLRYIFSESSWDRNFQVNNIWSADLND